MAVRAFPGFNSQESIMAVRAFRQESIMAVRAFRQESIMAVRAFRRAFRAFLPNANKGLIKALSKAGVDIYVCGQSAAYNGYSSDKLLPEVKIAVSAMTVHVRLQQEGYQAILF